MQNLALVTFLVQDYEEAIDWFTARLGFLLVENTSLGQGKRWVVVRGGATGAALLLAQAANERQRAAVGNQAGGRVGFFLETDDFDAAHSRMVNAGVRFLEGPRTESYGKVAVFEDLYGNHWDLIQHFDRQD
jgi:catechol 2,3-dioxygenase-like lactoylglutathione lyase family enzyme